VKTPIDACNGTRQAHLWEAMPKTKMAGASPAISVLVD
jgi:hypothetical protein